MSKATVTKWLVLFPWNLYSIPAHTYIGHWWHGIRKGIQPHCSRKKVPVRLIWHWKASVTGSVQLVHVMHIKQGWLLANSRPNELSHSATSIAHAESCQILRLYAVSQKKTGHSTSSSVIIAAPPVSMTVVCIVQGQVQSSLIQFDTNCSGIICGCLRLKIWNQSVKQLLTDIATNVYLPLSIWPAPSLVVRAR